MPDAPPDLRVPTHPLICLIRFRALSVYNQIQKGLREESRFKILVVGALGLLFWFGLFALFFQFFEFVNKNTAGFRLLLIRHILGAFFLALVFMLVFSNMVISFSSLFKSPETAFLFSLPVSHDTIFLYKFFESLIFSSWAVLAAGVPLLVAYGWKAGAAWYFYPIFAAFMIPFVILPAALGVSLGLLLTAFIPRHRGKVLGILVGGFLIGVAYMIYAVFGPQEAQANRSMEAAVTGVLGKLSFTQHFMLPNFWITEGLLGIAEKTGTPQASAIFFTALVASALFFTTLGWFLSGALYPSTYSLASGMGSYKRISGRSLLERILTPLMSRFPDVTILLIKDLKTFLRDPAQWSQVMIFFGILALYIGNLRNFSYPLEQAFYQNLISFLNLGATCMTLATMTSRFIFPMISLEGQRFWILGLVPMQRRDIILSKFLFSFGGSLLLTTTLVLLSNAILDSSRFVLIVQLATGVLISFSLSGLCVGMGAIFPNFTERNPSKIVSGFGGTLTLIIAISLVVFTIGAEGLLCHSFLLQHVDDPSARFTWQGALYGYVGAIVVLNLLAGIVPLRFGIRVLDRMEF